MNYPLTLSFKVMAVAPQFTVTDATGQVLFYVKQKAFKLKEAVTVFADVEQTRPVAHILADRVLDISATYRFQGTDGRPFGALKRMGLRSFWKAHYEVLRDGAPIFTIREENGWIKMLDGMLLQIPILNLLSGYVFNPAYRITRADGQPLLRVQKQPAFLEGRFRIERLAPVEPADEALAVLSILMMVLLERRRG
ncbi:MAG TPA: hypothetical protein VF192_13410 [Longimicrobiales bacterium]